MQHTHRADEVEEVDEPLPLVKGAEAGVARRGDHHLDGVHTRVLRRVGEGDVLRGGVARYLGVRAAGCCRKAGPTGAGKSGDGLQISTPSGGSLDAGGSPRPTPARPSAATDSALLLGASPGDGGCPGRRAPGLLLLLLLGTCRGACRPPPQPPTTAGAGND